MEKELRIRSGMAMQTTDNTGMRCCQILLRGQRGDYSVDHSLELPMTDDDYVERTNADALHLAASDKNMSVVLAQ